jgi:hypothetical protein
MSDLPAGRELDALVAEKVMGWKLLPIVHFVVTDIGEEVPCPRFSADIAAAWQVVEKLAALGKGLHLDMEKWWKTTKGSMDVIRDPMGKPEFVFQYVASFEFPIEWRAKFNVPDAKAWTLPDAICLAALVALKVKIPRNSLDTPQPPA